jgi:hypothetical protein
MSNEEKAQAEQWRIQEIINKAQIPSHYIDVIEEIFQDKLKINTLEIEKDYNRKLVDVHDDIKHLKFINKCLGGVLILVVGSIVKKLIES